MAMGGVGTPKTGQPQFSTFKNAEFLEQFQENDYSDVTRRTLEEQSFSLTVASRWNQTFPYAFYIVEEFSMSGNVGYNIIESAVIQLPINPSELSIGTDFANSLHATLGESPVEQFSVTQFRDISLSGNTGIAPFKKISPAPRTPGILESIFAGTFEAAGKLVDAVNGLVGADKEYNNIHKEGFVPSQPDNEHLAMEGTGYYQFHLLRVFLETYNTMRAAGNSQYKLVLAIPKDNLTYIVAPKRFDLRRSAQDPLKYNYNIVLRAWKKINLSVNLSPITSHKTAIRDAGILATVLNKINQAIAVLNAAAGVVTAVAADIDRILEIARELALFCKALGNLLTTIADMPGEIMSNIASTIDMVGDAVTDLMSDIQDFPDNLAKSWNAGVDAFKDKKGSGPSGLSAGIGRGSASPSKNLNSKSQSLAAALRNPRDNANFLGRVSLSDLKLPRQLVGQISKERNRVAALTRSEIQARAVSILEFSNNYANLVGASSPTFNRMYSSGANSLNKTPTMDDYKFLWALQDLALAADRLSVSAKLDNDKRDTTIEFIESMCGRSGIKFIPPRSKFLVPMPYGSTLEHLAARYLGDVNRWHEIAAVNNLLPPYIDETGYTNYLTVNGSGRVVVIADASQLTLNQDVWISSDIKGPSKRQITSITKVSDSVYYVELNGNADMGNYQTIHRAKIHAFLPGTVNSMGLIFIPSQSPEPEVITARFLPGVDDYDRLLRVGGTDLLLNSRGDLILEDGDFKIAYGLSNIMQTLRIGLATTKGDLLQHPTFGLAVEPGSSTADVSAQDILKSVKATFASDPAIKSISNAKVSQIGNAVYISLSVILAGTNETLPLSFALTR